MRVPIDTVPYVTTSSTYDFGNVLVGQAPQRKFTFTNKGSEPTTFADIEVRGAAALVNNTCSGTLASAQSRMFTAALNVARLGANAGEVRINHFDAAVPDVHYLRATGVQADRVISPVEPVIDVGDTAVRMPTAPQKFHLKNTGSTPLDIIDVILSEGATKFILEGEGCMTSLMTEETCEGTVTFNPQYQGPIQGRIPVELGDGTQVNTTSLVGAAVEKDIVRYGDPGLPRAFRRYARVWLPTDWNAAADRA